MFERFTEKAVMVVMLAQKESLSSGHNYLAPEQLLLGIMGAEDGLSFSALKDSGLTLELVRSEVAKLVLNGPDAVLEAIPFTEGAKRALELSWDEARKLGHRHIGTEHLLLGLLREPHSVAKEAMENLGVDITKLQQHVLAQIGETATYLENDENAEAEPCSAPDWIKATGKEETIGTLKWAIYENATSQLLLNGEKTLHTSDVEIKPIQKNLYNKKIELGGHFSFSLAENVARDIVDGEGFGLTGRRDDEGSFAWEWFDVDRSGHAKKLQESGELSFETKKTPNGMEISRMEFLSDVSIRIVRRSDAAPFNPVWRITIFKGSVITWPALVNGEVQ